MPIEEKKEEKDETNLKEAPSLIAKGLFVGAADVVPGISGGTVALILGIYTRLLEAIKSFDSRFVKLLFSFKIREAFRHIHFFFLGCLLTGIIGAIIFFTRIVPLPILIHTHPEPIYGLFFGLIAGSAWLLIKALPRFGREEMLLMAGGILFGFWVVNLVPTDTPENAPFVFFTGSIAVTALLLPGLSGSFILLIFRKYDYILSQVALLGTADTIQALTVLVPFGLGMVTGIVVFSRFLSWLLNRFYLRTFCILIGFMIGSIYILWPFQIREYEEFADTEITAVTDTQVQSLLADPDDVNAPEYQRIGSIVNPQAEVSEQLVELETVSRKLINSTPFWPDFQDPSQDERLNNGITSVYMGFLFMAGGFLLVGLLGRMADKKKVG